MKLRHIEEYWLTTSADDFDTAKILYEKGKYVQSMFFLHLSLEKALKELYVNKNSLEAPFGHNLVKLASSIKNLVPGEDENILLADVTSFNITSRYDDYKRNFYEICDRDFADEYIINTEKIIYTDTRIEPVVFLSEDFYEDEPRGLLREIKEHGVEIHF